MATVALLCASMMSWQASFRVWVMVKPGKAKGGSLMVIFLTMVSDIHRHSVVLPLPQFEDST
jgi:hypothetical protein